MTPQPKIDDVQVLSRVNARKHAMEVLEVIASEAATYDQDAGLRRHFSETIYYLLADNLGLVEHGTEESLPAHVQDSPRGVTHPQEVVEQTSWTARKPIGEYVFADLSGQIRCETDKAVCLRQTDGKEIWLPRSQIRDDLDVGDSPIGVWMKSWLAENNGWEWK